ncbi:MAG: class I SAM-dependent methyltransferase [Xanthomonadales bacterium]|nr:class I SAM-dependent methyltransferase [Xanthomonadales bacterium]
MKTNDPKPVLDFTGERFTPESCREIWYEHFHRYALASILVEGLDVLDAACGEGYGSAVLASKAALVTAVDISEETIAHASKRYSEHKNLNFIQADCTQLDFSGKQFDAIISFETLEHLQQQEAMLAGFQRALKPGGWLLISSPDKAEYSDAANYQNPWHVKELYKQELLDLLQQQFTQVRLYGQKLAFHSLIWDINTTGAYQSQTLTTDTDALENSETLQLKPTYFIALCAANVSDFPDLSSLNLFADQSASVYQHYEHEIRKNMAAGDIIHQRDQQISELEEQLLKTQKASKSKQKPAQQKGIFSRWFSK